VICPGNGEDGREAAGPHLRAEMLRTGARHVACWLKPAEAPQLSARQIRPRSGGQRRAAWRDARFHGLPSPPTSEWGSARLLRAWRAQARARRRSKRRGLKRCPRSCRHARGTQGPEERPEPADNARPKYEIDDQDDPTVSRDVGLTMPEHNYGSARGSKPKLRTRLGGLCPPTGGKLGPWTRMNSSGDSASAFRA